MDISAIITEEYETVAPDTRVSTLVGTFEDPSVNGVVVRDGSVRGVVTRRQLATSRHPPDEKVGSLVWHVPRLSPTEDVRKVAQLMIDSDSFLLPVVEGERLRGVVTVDGVLRAVTEFLDAATVREAASTDLVTVAPTDAVGEALHQFREHSITHLPVVADDDAVGILSLYDVTDVTVRAPTRSQGGRGGGTDAYGGSLENSAGRSRSGGFGSREGELQRLIDLPVRDVMASPVRTIAPDETLETAVEAMFDIDASSLVVTSNGHPFGIVTKTDVLDSLTWEVGGNRAVQVSGATHLDDATYDDVVELIDAFDAKDDDMTVLHATVHLHEHDEKRRGTPLLLARIRLHTDRGLYMASGEGFGASHALNETREVLERRIRDRKTRGKSKKHPDEDYWHKRFGWLLEA
jgi:CBS domain-containing protein